MPKPIQAVIFDQDGLMFDTESLAAASWFEIGPKYGIHVWTAISFGESGDANQTR